MTPIATTPPPAEPNHIYARRRAQLRILVDQRAAGNIAAFAEQFGYSRARVSQFLSETYNEGRSIGERAARALEEAAGAPLGWLDAGASPATSSTEAPADVMALILAELRGLRADMEADRFAARAAVVLS